MQHSSLSRRDLLRAGSALLGAAAAGGCGGGATTPVPTARATPTPAVDAARILDEALVVEHTVVYAYTQGMHLFGPATGPLAAGFRQHHADHRDRLAQLVTGLGGTPTAARDRYDLGTPPADENGVVSLVATLEEQAGRAHYAALRQISDPAILQALGSIMAAEAEHSAAWRIVLQQDPAPAAFVAV